MSARSDFGKHNPISKAKKRFEDWLQRQGYEECADMYPAAVEAVSLVDEYLREYPDHEEDRSVLEHHAEGIGWVSDYQGEEEDTDDVDDPDLW